LIAFFEKQNNILMLGSLKASIMSFAPKLLNKYSFETLLQTWVEPVLVSNDVILCEGIGMELFDTKTRQVPTLILVYEIALSLICYFVFLFISASNLSLNSLFKSYCIPICDAISASFFIPALSRESARLYQSCADSG